MKAIQEAVVVFQGAAMESESKMMDGDGETRRIWNVLRRRTGLRNTRMGGEREGAPRMTPRLLAWATGKSLGK